jgi:hypothetical protein
MALRRRAQSRLSGQLTNWQREVALVASVTANAVALANGEGD